MQLLPGDHSLLDEIPQPALFGAQSGRARLHFHEDDALWFSIAVPVEYYQVDGAPDKAGVLGIVLELREEWGDVFRDLPSHDRHAPLDGILSETRLPFDGPLLVEGRG